MAGWFFGIPGKSFENTGLSMRASTFTAPARSPMRMMPNHNAKIPVSPNEISNAFLDESKVASTIF